MIDYTEVAPLAIARGADRFFHGRLRDMAQHAAITHGTVNGDNHKLPFSSMRVAKGWPARGSVTLTRTDGAKFRLHLKGRTFKVDQIDQKGQS